jgi:hypothetical protein
MACDVPVVAVAVLSLLLLTPLGMKNRLFTGSYDG